MSSTKVISARVPLDQYVYLLARAKEANMTLADYLLFILFSDKKVVLQAERSIKQLQFDNNQHAANLSVLRTELEKANTAVEAWKGEVARLREAAKKAREAHNDCLNKAIEFLEKEDQESLFGNYKKEISRLKDCLWQEQP